MLFDTCARVLAIGVVCLVFGLGICSLRGQSIVPLLSSAAAATEIMNDHFRYDSIARLKEAGWVVKNDHLLSVDGHSVIMTSDGAQSGSIRRVFPTAISDDWGLEARMCATASSLHSSFVLEFLEKSRSLIYRFECDDSAKSFQLERWSEPYDRHSEYRKGGWDGYITPAKEAWVTLRIERESRILRFYFNDKLIGSYEEELAPQLAGIQLSAGFFCTVRCDFVQVQDLSSTSSFTSGPIQEMTPLFVFAVIVVSAFVAILLLRQRRSRTHRKSKETIDEEVKEW